MELRCRKCAVVLTTDNTSPSCLAYNNHICKKCNSIQARNYFKRRSAIDPIFRERRLKATRDWQSRHKDYLKNYERDYYRKCRLVINGRWMTVEKRLRPKTETCEICNRCVKRLSYHHWNDNQPSLGIWVCHFCHFIVETTEHFLRVDQTKTSDNTIDVRIRKYLTLKQDISENSKLVTLSQ